MTGKVERVSVHGGHSGQFCNHAVDTLDDIIQGYIAKGYSWVGITEHIPPPEDRFLYPDEVEKGLNAIFLQERFSDYIKECRFLCDKYRNEIELYTAMEIETYSGYETFVPHMVDLHRPDYLVGSIHHVDDMPIDHSLAYYHRAIEMQGGIDELYCRYFDQQYAMLSRLKPAVVGHFDLIRIFDDEYTARLQKPEIWNRIERNLDFIKAHNLILDYNIRSLLKGATEPYISRPILERVRDIGVLLAPGDDSHGVASIGDSNYDRAVALLKEIGISTLWPKPQLLPPPS